MKRGENMLKKLMNKVRSVEWQTEDGEMKGKYLVIGNISFFKGQWDGFLFHVMGLGVTKAEKALGFSKSERITFYCLRWGITFYSKNTSYKDCLQYVVVTKDTPVYQ